MSRLLALAMLLAAGSANATLAGIGDVLSFGDTDFDLSTDATFGAVDDLTVEAFLGLDTGTLDAVSGSDATEGSAVAFTTTLSGGDTVSFNWLWATNEFFENDFAFVTVSLDGVLAEATILADFFGNGFTDTGAFEYQYFGAGATLTLGIGVMDVGDTILDSFLSINDISQVPAPATLLLLGLGLAGIGAARRRA